MTSLKVTSAKCASCSRHYVGKDCSLPSCSQTHVGVKIFKKKKIDSKKCHVQACHSCGKDDALVPGSDLMSPPISCVWLNLHLCEVGGTILRFKQ